MEVLARSRLTSKEQLSLPAVIRRLLGIQAGDELVWIREDDGRLLVKAGRSLTLAQIREALTTSGVRPPAKPVSLKAMKEGIAKHIKEKHGLR
jgi:AbrB family looped-hinge helix DNA binding protein